jgi:hypothetical protein
MFSPLTPAEVVTAVGRAARDAARSDEPASEFSRGQLMSAFSVSRHLGVEIATFGPELRSFADGVADALRAGSGALACGDALQAAAGELAQAADAHRIGNLVAGALDDLRGDASPAATELRARLHAALRALADREVELLAEVIEAPRPA